MREHVVRFSKRVPVSVIVMTKNEEANIAKCLRGLRAFDEVFVSLVNTGEVSGTLDRIMEQTATYLERAEALRLKVQAALRYPVFVMGFAALVLVAMVVKIIGTETPAARSSPPAAGPIAAPTRAAANAAPVPVERTAVG